MSLVDVVGAQSGRLDCLAISMLAADEGRRRPRPAEAIDGFGTIDRPRVADLECGCLNHWVSQRRRPAFHRRFHIWWMMMPGLMTR